MIKNLKMAIENCPNIYAYVYIFIYKLHISSLPGGPRWMTHHQFGRQCADTCPALQNAARHLFSHRTG